MSTKIVKVTNTIVRKGNDGWTAKTYYNIVGGNCWIYIHGEKETGFCLPCLIVQR